MAEAIRAGLPFTSIQGFLHGSYLGGGATGQTLDLMVVTAPAQIRLVIAAAQAAGVNPTIIDVTNNGDSLWTNPADRPTIQGGLIGSFKSGRVNRSAVKSGDVLRLYVVQAGGGGSQIAATVALEDPSQRGG